MQKSDNSQSAKTAHRQVQSSTTLNRKYVNRPTRAMSSPRNIDVSGFPKNNGSQPTITHFSNAGISKPVSTIRSIEPARKHPIQLSANQKLRERQRSLQQQEKNRRLSAKELKDQAIKKALLSASKQSSDNSSLSEQIQTKDTSSKEKKMRFGIGRITLALSCAAAAIFAIVYFVNLNMPDIQFRATAAQLNAVYPNHIPYNYTPSEISSENNIVTITFLNKVSGDSFSVSEEKSSWDSNSLLNNYVKPTYKDDYATVREQGLTIFINNSNAAWVNGGVVYKLETKKGSLSKKQISDIAVSF